MTESSAQSPIPKPHRLQDGKPVLAVYDLRRTCIAAPSQWEGRVNDHGSIYIRYRWGSLTARVSLTDANAAGVDAFFYEDDSRNQRGDRLGGYMDTAEMQASLESVCHFNGECDEEAWQS